MKSVAEIASLAVAKHLDTTGASVNGSHKEVAARAAQIAIDEFRQDIFDKIAATRPWDGAAEAIAKATENADPERDGFAIEMALQYGATHIDDDAEIIGITEKHLADMMSVLGFRTSNERAADTAAKDVFENDPHPEVAAVIPVANAADPRFNGGQGLSEGVWNQPVKPGYNGLFLILMEALDQAQRGKGAERHNLGGDIPFERQRMQTISELIGSVDGMSYQACKKITEGAKLPTLERQVAEWLGAINYIAGMIVFVRKKAADDCDCGLCDDDPVTAAEANLKKQGIPT